VSGRSGCRRSRRNSSRSFMGSSDCQASIVVPVARRRRACHVMSATIQPATPGVTDTRPVSPAAPHVRTRKLGRAGYLSPQGSRLGPEHAHCASVTSRVPRRALSSKLEAVHCGGAGPPRVGAAMGTIRRAGQGVGRIAVGRQRRNLRRCPVAARLVEVGMSGGYCHIVLRLVETGSRPPFRAARTSLRGASPSGAQPIETRPKGF
jgi:hypothetical protein